MSPKEARDPCLLAGSQLSQVRTAVGEDTVPVRRLGESYRRQQGARLGLPDELLGAGPGDGPWRERRKECPAEEQGWGLVSGQGIANTLDTGWGRGGSLTPICSNFHLP